MIPIYPANSLKNAPLQGDITLSGLTNPPPLSLYIHIPWCVRKCPYCDFNSHEARQEIPEAAYVDALIADLEQATPLVWGRKIRSIFFGGGTPSIFSAEAIDKILSHVRMLTPLEYGAAARFGVRVNLNDHYLVIKLQKIESKNLRFGVMVLN